MIFFNIISLVHAVASSNDPSVCQQCASAIRFGWRIRIVQCSLKLKQDSWIKQWTTSFTSNLIIFPILMRRTRTSFTCHGCFPNRESRPPTILRNLLLTLPQPEKIRQFSWYPLIISVSIQSQYFVSKRKENVTFWNCRRRFRQWRIGRRDSQARYCKTGMIQMIDRNWYWYRQYTTPKVNILYTPFVSGVLWNRVTSELKLIIWFWSLKFRFLSERICVNSSEIKLTCGIVFDRVVLLRDFVFHRRDFIGIQFRS